MPGSGSATGPGARELLEMWSLRSLNPTPAPQQSNTNSHRYPHSLHSSDKNKTKRFIISRVLGYTPLCPIHLLHLYLPTPLHIHLETTLREEHWQWYALSGMQWTIQCTFALYLTFRSSLTEWILLLLCRYKTVKCRIISSHIYFALMIEEVLYVSSLLYDLEKESYVSR